MAIPIPQLDRLKSQLLTSGLSQKDQPLFQIINQLIDVLRQSTTEIVNNVTTVASAATPGGVDGNVQFNSGGSFGGASDLVYDNPTKTTRIGNQVKTTYKLNIVGNGLVNQSLLGIFTSNIIAPAFDVFIDGGGNGVWRVINPAAVIKVQVSANGDSFFAGGYVGFTGGFPAFAPSAFVHLGAGNGFVPLKFTLSALTGVAQPGAIEYDGSFVYYTDNAGIRRPLGSAGPIGPPGMPGYDGEDGDDGIPGIQGPQGFAGTIGANGAPGIPGIDGIDGEIGEQGIPGPIGPAGINGTIGINGIAGPPGMDGMNGEEYDFPYLGPPIINYPENALVFLSGNREFRNVTDSITSLDPGQIITPPGNIPGFVGSEDGFATEWIPFSVILKQVPQAMPGIDAEEPEIPYFLPVTNPDSNPSTLIYFTQDLGTSRSSGQFDIAGTFYAGQKFLTIFNVTEGLASRGFATDEFEMSPILAIGRVLNSTTARISWASAKGDVVVGQYRFGYAIFR